MKSTTTYNVPAVKQCNMYIKNFNNLGITISKENKNVLCNIDEYISCYNIQLTK